LPSIESLVWLLKPKSEIRRFRERRGFAEVSRNKKRSARSGSNLKHNGKKEKERGQN